jgi:Tol biopolymer transport system component
VHPDATGLEAIKAPDGTTILDGMHPASSPTGRYLVYSVYVPFPTLETRVLDTSTGQTAVISGVEGATWMKGSDTLIAFRSAGHASIVLLRPDGSEVRSVPYDFGWSGFPPYDVSPDGRWLVVQRNGFELVSLESGAVIPLTFTIGLGAPAWRP